MITPADVARMHANAAVNHALSPDDPDFDPLVPDELMYTSQTTTVHLNTVLDEARAVKAKLGAERIESASTQAAHMPTPAECRRTRPPTKPRRNNPAPRKTLCRIKRAAHVVYRLRHRWRRPPMQHA